MCLLRKAGVQVSLLAIGFALVLHGGAARVRLSERGASTYLRLRSLVPGLLPAPSTVVTGALGCGPACWTPHAARGLGMCRVARDGQDAGAIERGKSNRETGND